MILAKFLQLAKCSLDVVLICVGSIIYYCGLAHPVIWMGRRVPKVLMYHACEDRESDFTRGLSINTTPAHFAAQLDFLQEYYQVVPLSALSREPWPDRALVITFDDGFRSVYDQAFPQLRTRNLPAICYLATDVLEGQEIIWLNELNWFLERHPSVVMPLVWRRLGLKPHSSRNGFIKQVIGSYDRETIAELLAEIRDQDQHRARNRRKRRFTSITRG